MNRVSALRERMQAENLDGYIVLAPENRRYISGFTGTNALLLITRDQAFLYTDFRYIEQAAAQAKEFQIVKSEREVFSALAEAAGNLNTVGFEGDFVSFENYLKLKENLSPTNLVSKPNLIPALRSVKGQDEIALIRKAVNLSDKAFEEIINLPLVGKREDEISIELEVFMRRQGASGGSFDFIVASGWRSSLPHGVGSSKTIQKGELLTLDFGAIYEGYCSDITRTVCLGQPDPRQLEIYDIVLSAQQAALESVRPGLAGKEIDGVARKIIADAGYGEFFGHGLGHSVGLAIHEGPNLSPREERLLEPGMVITVEPGIYIPGWGGVRIEDMILVTENGCEILTQAPKQFIIVD